MAFESPFLHIAHPSITTHVAFRILHLARPLVDYNEKMRVGSGNFECLFYRQTLSLMFLKKTGKSGLPFLALHGHEGYQHFLHGDASMLEGVFVIRDIIIVVVGIGKKVVARDQDIACADIWRGELCFVWLFDDKHFLGIVAKIFAEFVAQIGIGVSVADNFYGV